MINIEKIWDEYKVPLKQYIKWRVANQWDAEDILQSVFYKICLNENKLKNPDKARSWIYQITRNSIIDYYRMKQDNLDISEVQEETLFKEIEEKTVNHEISMCLTEMVKSLPEKYKEAILLTEYQEMPQNVYGAAVGISNSGARSRVQRARVKLKDTLMDCCNLEFDSFGGIVNYEHKKDNCKFC